MHVIYTTNVNTAYDEGMRLILSEGVEDTSSVGPVLVLPVPLMTVYGQPNQRVLLDTARDANPFFHLFESLWMLSGMNDATWLDRFVSDFSSRFSEDGTQWGAYGHRWRYHFGTDQIADVVDVLKKNPKDRRAVIQMWDPRTDMMSTKRDVPCNTSIYPRIVDGRLDITVSCRSNDLMWGCYGANAVHFSILQEYMAGKLGVDIGRYYQLSNNAHLYTNMVNKAENRSPVVNYPGVVPLGNHWAFWDDDLGSFMYDPESTRVYANDWFNTVAHPMWMAHMNFKEGQVEETQRQINRIAAPDWREAANNWVRKRQL